MSAAPPQRTFRLRRWLLSAAFALCAAFVLSGGLLGLYLSRPQDGLAHELLDAIEYPLRDNEGLRYNVHTVLGKVFSLCPCTAGLSADQYRRAWFHRPERTPNP